MILWSLEHVYTVTENMKMSLIEESVLQGVELKYLVRHNLIFFNWQVTESDDFLLTTHYHCMFVLF